MQYANPVAAADASRNYRAFWMQQARLSHTDYNKARCVKIARVYGHDVVRALRQAD